MRDLVGRAARGDREALAEIVAQHDSDMRRLCYFMCGDVTVVEDAVQDAWLQAIQKLGTLRDPSRVRPWLLSIAANQLRGSLRRRRLERNTQIVLRRVEPPTVAGAIEWVDLTAALSHLSVEQRELVALRYVLGFDASEIAQMDGSVSPTGVRTRLKRAMDRLREEFHDQ